MTEFEKIVKRGLRVSNSDIDLDARLQERATRPIRNSQPLAEVDCALDLHAEDALEATRENRRAALSDLRKR